MSSKSLYIHIPFCNKLCYYCDFNKVFYNEKFSDLYIDDLISSLSNNSNTYSTIYVGGGSPSSLSTIQLDKLLKEVSKHLDNEYEFTIELNPNDISLDKILILKKYKVNRISLGVQTFNDSLLKYINRDHNKELVINSINMLKDNGFNNISCDLMFGIPNQTKQDILNDLDILTSLNIPHISTYALLIEPNTYFDIKHIQALDDDKEADYYDLISKYLKDKGYIHYEISNFSLPTYESKHNLVYWTNKEYVGLGAGSSGYEEHIRYTYTKSINTYINEHKIIEKEILNKDDLEYEYIILHLRLKDGVNIRFINNLFNIDFIDKYKEVIDKLISDNLCIIEEDCFKVKEENFFILNRILTYF